MTPIAKRDDDLREDDAYALWDAAYVLGSLSGSERREFEAHMATCPSCRAAVSELSGIWSAGLRRAFVEVPDVPWGEPVQ